jgi:hypothetical protein
MALASALVFRVRLARMTALVAVYIAFLMTVDRYYIRKHFNFIRSYRNAANIKYNQYIISNALICCVVVVVVFGSCDDARYVYVFCLFSFVFGLKQNNYGDAHRVN